MSALYIQFLLQIFFIEVIESFSENTTLSIVHFIRVYHLIYFTRNTCVSYIIS